MIHELKSWPEPFSAVWDGSKRHEVRANDRNFQVYDVLVLREWDPATGAYLGRRITALITYMSTCGTFGLPSELCVLSISVTSLGSDRERERPPATFNMRDRAALLEVQEEISRARAQHGPFNSAHEGYAVILEELDELWEEVRHRREARLAHRLRDEARQVAAMAIRFMTDVASRGEEQS